jgi:hypothetical protein
LTVEIRTSGDIVNQTGKLKGPIIITVPLGSFRTNGFIAAKVMENGGLSGFAHLATPLYDCMTSPIAELSSRLSKTAIEMKKYVEMCPKPYKLDSNSGLPRSDFKAS